MFVCLFVCLFVFCCYSLNHLNDGVSVLQAAKSYSSSVRKQETDPTQLDVADYILTKISQYMNPRNRYMAVHMYSC